MSREVAAETIAERLSSIAWERIEIDLNEYGGAVLEQLLTSDECESVTAMYPDDAAFRSRVVMARHGFGRGEYKYFRYPLPKLVGDLRTHLYPRLAPIANRWNEALRTEPEGVDNRDLMDKALPYAVTVSMLLKGTTAWRLRRSEAGRARGAASS